MKEQNTQPFYNKHYILLDASNNIIDTWSDGSRPEKDTSKAICINEQGGYQFKLFQDGEENPPIFNIDGTPIYKYEEGEILPLTKIEKTIYQAKQDNKNLPTIKSQLVADSKKQLELYLDSHPLTWTDKKQYTVTQEKQALLTQQLALYTLDSETKLYWNARGEACQVWPITALASLSKAIADYVRPFVHYQQQKEAEIMSAETADEARNIEIDFSSIA